MKAEIKKKLIVSFSKNDYAKVKTAAHKKEMPISTYIRQTILAHVNS